MFLNLSKNNTINNDLLQFLRYFTQISTIFIPSLNLSRELIRIECSYIIPPTHFFKVRDKRV